MLRTLGSDISNYRSIAKLTNPTMKANIMPNPIPNVSVERSTVVPRRRSDREHSSTYHTVVSRYSSIHKADISSRPTVIRPGRAVVKLGNNGFGGVL